MAPFKRIRQPKMTTQALLDFELGESSSDSDFRIEDQDQDSNDANSSNTSDDENDSDTEDSESEGVSSDDSTQQLKDLLADDGSVPQTNGGDALETMLKKLDCKKENEPKVPTKPICGVCLGDRSDDSNEIIECDGCGVSVHEGCYGVSDNVSISSTNSTCSTEPWFCEACRAGVTEPACELCPNKGGIYKETDVGKWVHLICALYIPGVAFGEVDQLSSVTLFEMPYSKWGAKMCSLCENSCFARSGVCIGCDAGMCKTYFHVTCAQAAGFLTEAHHEEADAADPFFAHCKVHSEKELIKKRKRNFHTFRLNMQQKLKEKQLLKLEDPCPAQVRIMRKLVKYQSKYASTKQLKADPWVPTQKMSRLLTTSASACKRLLTKATIMQVDVELLERQEAQIAALTDIRKKWHIAPAFSVEFIGYYLDRISRSKDLKEQLTEMMESNVSLSAEQDSLRKDYDARLDKNKELKAKQESLMSAISQMHIHITAICPNKSLPSPSNIGRVQQELNKASSTPSRPISVPTAAALKMGVGFPLAHLGPPGTKVDSTRLLSTHAKSSPPTGTVGTVSPAPATPALNVQTFECGICKRGTDQHLLAKCDTCQLHYHLGCLNPPLARHPKKSKLYGWQCSECDKSDDSDVVEDVPKGPRKSRTRFNKDGSIMPVQKLEKNTTSNVGPITKRHSVNATPSPKTITTKNNLNKSLPVSTETATPPESLSKMSQAQALLGRKTKCFVSLKNIKEKPYSVNKIIMPPLNKNAPKPVQANLPTDEPLLVVPPTVRPRTVDPIHTPDPDPLALPVNSNTTISSVEDSSDLSKQARKQKRKDKHKNKHNLSSDTEKSPNKEHKRKRKKKLHDDVENPNDGIQTIPKIKIKFKTLPLPGEVTPEAQFFYVSADMVRSAEEASRPTSVETVEDSTPMLTDENSSPVKVATTNSPATIAAIKVTPTTRKTSPRKTAGKRNVFQRSRSMTIHFGGGQNLNCCVCREPGENTNVVTCDECRRHYHFTCLDPPLKKTPKIRGYSWHCADCDPTDEEK